jgi:hypothetical protein
MPAISELFGSGGANMAPGGAAGEPTLADALRAAADDFANVKSVFNLLLAKLDADTGTGDSDYVDTLEIGGTVSTKPDITLTKNGA